MQSNHVVLLGAGFSRSVNAHMPLTDELGSQAVEFLRADGRIDGAGLGFGPELTFESWLSLLSEDQPQLSEAENRDNAALFAHLRDAIAACLLAAQREALISAAPSWLYELLSVLNVVQTTVLTLNYDTLIENAIASHSLWDPFNRQRLMVRDVLRDLPPLPDTGARLGGPLADTFRLLKLHGSLDWWAVPNDQSGATLNREEMHGGFEELYEISAEERQYQLPGRERFIIPPLSTKSTYYRNPLVRELWQQASAALKRASRISMIGYSLPPADPVITNMLRTALTDRDVRVDLVNPDPEGLEQRLIGLGANPELLTVTSDERCVESFARALCGEATAQLAEDLNEPLPLDALTASLAVAWGSSEASGTSMRRVVELSEPDGDTLELILEDDAPPQGATSVRRSADGSPTDQAFPTGADLSHAVWCRNRIIARDSQGAHTLISHRREGRNFGANKDWIVLVPADRLPD